MTESLLMQPVTRRVTGSIRPPGSKSITNRALILAALAEETTYLTGVLDSVDTQVMFSALEQLGIAVERDAENAAATIHGCGGQIPAKSAELDLHNSGTSIRFLTGLCALGNGTFTLDGIERMRERPIGDLIDALNQIGGRARCVNDTGCPPVAMDATGLSGGRVVMKGNSSSQFLSALLMAAPAAAQAVELEIDGELVSRPYVDMTIAMMRQFGGTVQEPRPNHFHIQPAAYTGRAYDIEPDASAASYFLAAAAMTGGEVTIDGLARDALQGDVGFADALERMGCRVTWTDNSVTVAGGMLTGIDIDMNSISDTAQTLAAVAVFAEGSTRIRNVEHNRVKETDRITAVVTELQRMGIDVEEHQDGMTIHPGEPRPATIHTYDDHRMAMSFALIGLRAEGIRIADPDCTSKTYPNFFADLETLCG